MSAATWKGPAAVGLALGTFWPTQLFTGSTLEVCSPAELVASLSSVLVLLGAVVEVASLRVLLPSLADVVWPLLPVAPPVDESLAVPVTFEGPSLVGPTAVVCVAALDVVAPDATELDPPTVDVFVATEPPPVLVVFPEVESVEPLALPPPVDWEHAVDANKTKSMEG